MPSYGLGSIVVTIIIITGVIIIVAIAMNAICVTTTRPMGRGAVN